MPLFNIGTFVLHSGSGSRWKVDCDALTKDDLEALALMASEMLPVFGRVVGVPRGGLAFAKELEKYVTQTSSRILIADDVLTTGKSMREERDQHGDPHALGIVIFARNAPPPWIMAIWRMG